MKTNHLLMILPGLLLASCAEQEPLADPIAPPLSVAVAAESTDEVTTGDIARVAESFFGDGKAKTRSGGYSISTIYGEDGMPAIYAVNFAGDNGFILVSATKRMLPVLAYSETGHYDVAGQKPGGLDLWQASAVEAVAAAGTLPADSTEAYRFMWRKYEEPAMPAMAPTSGMDEYVQAAQAIMMDSVMSWTNKHYEVHSILGEITGDPQKDEEIREMVRTGIHPYLMDYWDVLSMVVIRDASDRSITENFISTQWDQVGGFNQSFPSVAGKLHAYAGCGPVAVGQVMRYYQHPASYNWNAMPDIFSTKTTSDLLYELAEKANAVYSSDATTTYLEDFEPILQSYGYNATYGDHELLKAWENIQQKKPVLMRANVSTNGGHTWVASGGEYVFAKTILEVYTFREYTLYLPVYNEYTSYELPIYRFYMNWGWGGKDNGFFVDESLLVPGSTITNVRKDIYDISPK